MAEGRLMRALVVSGATGIEGGPRAGRESVFKNIAEAMAEAEREAKALDSRRAEERFAPGPADLKDWDVAMAWFAALDPPDLRPEWREPWSLTSEQKVLVWRAQRRSFVAIAGLLGLSHHEPARRLYAGAIERAWRVANGLRDGQRRPRDAMADLRERNRAHGRREAAEAGY
jgi:hypothetical protein